MSTEFIKHHGAGFFRYIITTRIASFVFFHKLLCLLITTVLITSYIFCQHAVSQEKYYSVIKVESPDTLGISYKGRSHKISFIGIKVPEWMQDDMVDQYCGKEAYDYLNNLLANNDVRLVFEVAEPETTAIRLPPAYVYVNVKDGNGNQKEIMLNEELIRNGFASIRTGKETFQYFTRFLSLQVEAQKKKIGIWGDNTCKPVDFSNCAFIAPSKTGIYHKPDCELVKQIDPKEKVCFKSRDASLYYLGYSVACSKCLENMPNSTKKSGPVKTNNEPTDIVGNWNIKESIIKSKCAYIKTGNNYSRYLIFTKKDASIYAKLYGFMNVPPALVAINGDNYKFRITYQQYKYECKMAIIIDYDLTRNNDTFEGYASVAMKLFYCTDFNHDTCRYTAYVSGKKDNKVKLE